MQVIILIRGFIAKFTTVDQSKPLLAYFLDYLKDQHVQRVIFAMNSPGTHLKNYFKSNYQHMDIFYSVATYAAGTGGAIVKAFSLIDKHQPVFILTGEHFVKIDYQAMQRYHCQRKATVTMVLASANMLTSGAKAIVENEIVIGFDQRHMSTTGLTNAGLYLIDSDLFNEYQLPEKFCFEQDFLFHHVIVLKPHIWITQHVATL